MRLFAIDNENIIAFTGYPNDSFEEHFTAINKEIVKHSETDSLGNEILPETHIYRSGVFRLKTPDLDELKSDKIDELLKNIKFFISTKPNGKVRYDDDLKFNMVNTLFLDPDNQYVAQFREWHVAVMSKYFELKNAINNATLDTLDSIDVSYDLFESLFGVDGTLLSDPDISTEDLVGV